MAQPVCGLGGQILRNARMYVQAKAGLLFDLPLHHKLLPHMLGCVLLPRRLAELQAALEAANAEKAAAKQQLARLKQQMLTEQDDEEEKIRCRRGGGGL